MNFNYNDHHNPENINKFMKFIFVIVIIMTMMKMKHQKLLLSKVKDMNLLDIIHIMAVRNTLIPELVKLYLM